MGTNYNRNYNCKNKYKYICNRSRSNRHRCAWLTAAAAAQSVY